MNKDGNEESVRIWRFAVWFKSPSFDIDAFQGVYCAITIDCGLQVDKLRLELEGRRSDNAELRRESQLVVTNVSRWITEQK